MMTHFFCEGTTLNNMTYQKKQMSLRRLGSARIILLAVAFVFAGLSLFGQDARVVKLEELKQTINGPGESVRVINFWATWCGPCVKELPYFEKVGKERKDVEVILVSTDLDLDPNPDKVHRFVKRKSLTSRVLILEAQKGNDWIDELEKEWSGALPATIVLNPKTGKKKFVGQELHEGELEKLIAEVQ